MPEIKLQFKYILVIIDTNIKYVEIFPVKSTTQAEVAQVFYTKFIFKHGVPKEGHPDNGAPFSSLFYTQVSKVLDSELIFTQTCHQTSNGTVEKLMLMLKMITLHYFQKLKSP